MSNLITAHPAAAPGKVQHLAHYEASSFIPGSAILCRNTAPLVAFAYSLLRRDVPCRILGRDIGAALITIVKRLRAASLPHFFVRLDEWRTREIERAIGEGRSPEKYEDQAACLRFFAESLDADSQSIVSLIAKIELLFTDDDSPSSSSSRVTLSTVHKAKGLEYPSVFILDFARYMPSKFARQPWQKEQERNLIYVAITRAIETLYYVNSDCWKGDAR